MSQSVLSFFLDREMGCGKEGLNKGAWTANEDKILTEYIKVHGEGKWKKLPRQAGLKRCGKSCRLRWLNYLKPDIKRGNITDDEKDLIIRLHQLLGNRWSLIAGRLPGRTANEIKNYWNTYIVKKTIRGRPGLTPNWKLDSTRHPPIRRRASPNNGPPAAAVVHHPKPSRCTKVFFPTDKEAAPGMILNEQVVRSDETIVQDQLAMAHDHHHHHCQKAAETTLMISSPPLMISSGNDGFIMEGDFIYDDDQLFLNPDHISQLFDFTTGFEADSSNINASGITNSSPTDSPLQNPNLFSVDYFLDSGMDGFCTSAYIIN